MTVGVWVALVVGVVLVGAAVVAIVTAPEACSRCARILSKDHRGPCPWCGYPRRDSTRKESE